MGINNKDVQNLIEELISENYVNQTEIDSVIKKNINDFLEASKKNIKTFTVMRVGENENVVLYAFLENVFSDNKRVVRLVLFEIRRSDTCVTRTMGSDLKKVNVIDSFDIKFTSFKLNITFFLTLISILIIPVLSIFSVNRLDNNVILIFSILSIIMLLLFAKFNIK